MKTVQELVTHVQTSARASERYVIAISGFGGAGKSTTSEQLSKLLGNTTLIHADDFIAADENGALEGYHLDWPTFEEQVITVAKTAKRLTSRIYDWPSNRPVHEEVAAAKYVLVEGSMWLFNDRYKPYFDLTIWVDVPQAVANARGKRRDTEVYGVDHDELWDTMWGPREKQSFEKLRPDQRADITYQNSDAATATHVGK